MFRVVTVEREYGSGGAEVAERVAEDLGWRLLDQSLIEAVARRAQVDVGTARRCDERLDSWWHRLNRDGLWSAAVATGAAPADAQFFDAETMTAITEEVIRGAASKGNCVIVGRGAQCVLRDMPQALHVFLYGSWAARIARVQKRLGTNRDVSNLLLSIDRSRAAYLRRYFGCDWRDPDLYQMIISSQLGIERVASLITDAAKGTEVAAIARASGF
jgi:cytidylate kinase